MRLMPNGFTATICVPKDNLNPVILMLPNPTPDTWEATELQAPPADPMAPFQPAFRSLYALGTLLAATGLLGLFIGIWLDRHPQFFHYPTPAHPGVTVAAK